MIYVSHPAECLMHSEVVKTSQHYYYVCYYYYWNFHGICLLFERCKTSSHSQLTKVHTARVMKSHSLPFILELDSLTVTIYNSDFIFRLS